MTVLVAAAGAGWESSAVALLGGHPRLVVLKRCVDVDDLLATASSGQADAAVLAVDAPGLDAAAVDHLRAYLVRPVAVVPGGAARDAACLRATRVGIRAVVGDDDLASLAALVAEDEPDAGAVRAAPDVPPPPTPDDGRLVVAVWGPAGAPGRTTGAAALAGALARRALRTVLVDADPWGGAVAQQLAVLDEVSGLLSAARLSAGGTLPDELPSLAREVAPHLAVVTGLPRSDRWTEIRPGVLAHVLEVARAHAHVVVDTGFSLESDPAGELGSRPTRNQMTLEALATADEVVVVGSADPVGLARLARGLVDLRDHLAAAPVRVVVNRMRPTLGWSEKDVAGMVEGFTRLTGLHFLPEDRPAADQALVAGRALGEGDTPLGRALAGLADAVVPGSAPPPTGRLRRRTAGTTRPR